jgi:hypothetical protein
MFGDCSRPLGQLDVKSAETERTVHYDLFDGHAALSLPELLKVEQKETGPGGLGGVDSDRFAVKSIDGSVRAEVRNSNQSETACEFVAPRRQLASIVKDALKNDNPTVEWIREDIKSIHGNDFLVLGYRATVGGRRIQALFAMTDVGTHTVTMAWCYPEDKASTWAPLANEALESLDVKK